MNDPEGTEIERKFIVANLPVDLQAWQRQTIRQGYIVMGDGGTEVRLRIKGDARTQTIKRGRGIERLETEISLTEDQFNRLWPLTAGARIEKVRYERKHGEQLVALDVYSGDLDGLLTVEVEFADREAGAGFRPPDWFGRDVTADQRYKNSNLAVHGRPDERHGAE